MARMYLIVGLGNPEDKYDGTRHNLGFEVMDHLAHKLGSSSQGLGSSWEREDKFKSEILRANYTLSTKPYSLILVKPQTYMNLSGLAVSSLAKFYKISPENIIVIHDDLDLVLGKIKVRLGGGAAGHHGVESVIKSLGTDKFLRIRLGIGNTAGFLGEHKRVSFEAEKFVMEPFSAKEKSKVKSMTKLAIQAVEAILEKGTEVAQNQYN